MMTVMMVEVVDSKARTIGVLGMGAIGFYKVCGGPFGIEVALGAAGPLYLFISFLVLPLVWAIPQALMTIELSTMIPENGGYVVWVRDAFGVYGEFASWVSGCCGVLASMFDIALYPTIFVSYLKILTRHHFHWSWWSAYACKLALLYTCVLLNIRGMTSVTKLSAVLTVSIFLPYIVQVFTEFNAISHGGDAWLQRASDDDADWGLFTSTLLWSYTGWDGLGLLAGEVHNPGRTYPCGIALAIVLVTIMYFLPIFVAIQTHPAWQTYTDGSLGRVAHDFSMWMGVWIDLASMTSNFGLLLVSLGASSRALWSMGDSAKWTHTLLPPALGRLSPSLGTPVVSLLVFAAVSSLLCMGDFAILVETEVFLVAVNLFLEFGAYVWFRWRQPTRHRPWKVPGGWYGVVAITTPKVALLTFALVSADWVSWCLAGAFLVVVMCYYYYIAVYRASMSSSSYGKLVSSSSSSSSLSSSVHPPSPPPLPLPLPPRNDTTAIDAPHITTF